MKIEGISFGDSLCLCNHDKEERERRVSLAREAWTMILVESSSLILIQRRITRIPHFLPYTTPFHGRKGSMRVNIWKKSMTPVNFKKKWWYAGYSPLFQEPPHLPYLPTYYLTASCERRPHDKTSDYAPIKGLRAEIYNWDHVLLTESTHAHWRELQAITTSQASAEKRT